MSLKDAAQHLQSYGRHGDTMLAHINPEEAALLKARGGSGTINPNTGLPEFWNPLSLKSWTGSEGLDLGGKNSGIASLALGALLGPAGYGLSTGMAGLATGAAMGLATGSLQKGIMAGLSAYGGAGLAEGVMNLGTGALSQSVGTGLTEEAAQQAVADKLAGASTMDKLSAAGNALIDKPMDSLKAIGGGSLANTAKYGLAATLPIMAGSGVPTTTAMPTAGQAPGWIRPFAYDPRTQGLHAFTPIRASSVYAKGGVVEPSDDGMVHAFGGGMLSDITDAVQEAAQTATTPPPVATPEPRPQPDFLDAIKQAAIQKEMIDAYKQQQLAQQTAQQAQQQAITAPFQNSEVPAQAALSQALSYTPTTTPFTPTAMTGDSAAAFNYLMGKSDYPYITQDKEVFRPYTDILAQKATAQPAPAQSLGTGMQGIGNIRGGEGGPSQGVTPMPEVRFPQQPAAPAPVPAPIRTPEDTGIQPNPMDLWPTPMFADGGLSMTPTVTTSNQLGQMLDDDLVDAYERALQREDVSKAKAFKSEIDYRGRNPSRMATGGISDAHYNLGGYSDGGRLLRGPGDGVSDDIPATIGKNRQPARLADGEFVVPARIVSELGNGSTEAGARKLYAMMDRIQKARSKTVGKGRVAKNTRADKYLPA